MCECVNVDVVMSSRASFQLNVYIIHLWIQLFPFLFHILTIVRRSQYMPAYIVKIHRVNGVVCAIWKKMDVQMTCDRLGYTLSLESICIYWNAVNGFAPHVHKEENKTKLKTLVALYHLCMCLCLCVHSLPNESMLTINWMESFFSSNRKQFVY